MASLNEKIVAITQLMQDGILTAEELSKIIQCLSSSGESVAQSKTPAEQKYESIMQDKVAYGFKSPSGIKFPPLTSDMIKEGELQISQGLGSKKHVLRYIHTYVDAPNAYGTMLRENIALVIDDDFNVTMVLQELKNPFSGKTLGQWMKMPGVDV